MDYYFCDGDFVRKSELSISIDDRGYYFGDGIYEVIKIYDGSLYTAKEHLTRLYRSAKEIKIVIPFELDELVAVALQLIQKNNVQNGHIYLQVTRGVFQRQHNFPETSVKPVITAYAVDTVRPLDDMKQGVTIKSVEDIRWLRCDIKSLNLLGSVLAKEEAAEAGYAEAILHRDGIVTEGASTNMFGVKDGVVYTHPATNLILNGITRQVVLNLCGKLSIPFVEKTFTIDEARTMDEFFYTSTNAEVMPVNKIDEHFIGDGKPGPVTLQLQKAFGSEIPLKLKDQLK